MNKTLKITINILVFALIAGFGYYMVHSMVSDGGKILSGAGNAEDTLVTPYKRINRFLASSDIICFDIDENAIYAAQSGKISVFDLAGKHQRDFLIKNEVRDIVVEDEQIYLLYPAEIEVFTLEGRKIAEWTAHRKSTDYCSITLSVEYIFVTDAENKHICRYTREGEYLDVILSPNSFVIPSYAFDIINVRDTLYCSNSGRNRVERFTLEGKYIDSFGKAGSEAGSFAGCCNPTYLAATQYGDIITSEKGNPRISCFSRDGKFRTILLGSKMLGGGTNAYSVKVQEDRMYVAGKKTVSVFVFDPDLAAESACADCPLDCPLKK